MTKIKLGNGEIINCSTLELVGGNLKFTTKDKTVEELAELFKDIHNTANITLLTESEIESGYKIGFTSFGGISYDEEGNKTIELFQPGNPTEKRISQLEGNTTTINNKIDSVETKMTEQLEEAVTELTMIMSMSANK